MAETLAYRVLTYALMAAMAAFAWAAAVYALVSLVRDFREHGWGKSRK